MSWGATLRPRPSSGGYDKRDAMIRDMDKTVVRSIRRMSAVGKSVKVAVLLATYNGEKFVEAQIKSLGRNHTPFSLHWLDDTSTDNTRGIVRDAASQCHITLVEWHQPQKEGIPGAFFRLLECVEADIYLFCDQDDIWQAGKIDAAVENLRGNLAAPVLCFSDPWMFRDTEPDAFYRFSSVLGVNAEASLDESRLFMPATSLGNTQAFTRPLRELFLAHAEVARLHAAVHDMWFYFLAVASGSARMLTDVPTTLYRRHGNAWCDTYGSWRGPGRGRYVVTWKQHQLARRVVARHAQGFLLLSSTLPKVSRLDRFLSIAQKVSALERRQSVGAISRLIRDRVMWPSRKLTAELAAVCLCSDAV